MRIYVGPDIHVWPEQTVVASRPDRSVWPDGVPRRKGMVIFLVLLAVALFSIVLAVTTTQALAQRRLAQQRNRQLQADWLARAGVEVAAAQLLENAASFKLERKDIAPDGVVQITVEKSDADLFDVRAEATINAEGLPPVIRSAHTRFQRRATDGVVRLRTIADIVKD